MDNRLIMKLLLPLKKGLIMKYLLLSAFLLLSISLTLNAMEYGCCKTQLFPEIPDPSPSEESQQGDSDSNPYLGHHLLFYKPELTVKQVVCPVNPDYEPKEVTPEQREYFKQKTNVDWCYCWGIWSSFKF